jgi:transcription-repair coupling factor (superfamily II helicase)
MSLPTVLDAFDRSPGVQELAGRLPGRDAALRLGGLPGSSGAVLAAWLAGRFPQRLLAIVAPTPADAERWLTDLAHLTDQSVALYPQREALGEEEPHYEIAGERAETIEALFQGRLRILVTTARATAERTLVPAALQQPRWPSSAPEAAFWTCTDLEWPCQPGWNGGETTSRRCAGSI